MLKFRRVIGTKEFSFPTEILLLSFAMLRTLFSINGIYKNILLSKLTTKNVTVNFNLFFIYNFERNPLHIDFFLKKKKGLEKILKKGKIFFFLFSLKIKIKY